MPTRNTTDPQPKRRPPPPLPDAVKNFPNLPDDARVNVRTFRILLGGIGSTTFHRRRAAGDIPPPDRFNTWSVGTVRQILNGNQEAA